MSDFLARVSQFSPKRLALLADELNDRVQRLERGRHEPIAIVGIGCRLPGGADTPERFWQLVQDGTDAIVEVPRERWDINAWYDADPDAPGKMASRWGGFLGPVDGFDPAFFGISPREAQNMDPQQRLLLEVTWEALEDAAIPADRIAGSRTGVFIGMSAGDYFQILRDAGPRSYDAYTASGVAHSIAAGRLSYLLGARGPSVAIDTACSSSLVAIHTAMQSLRRGECDMALAGGVNLILTPDITVALSRSHMLAPDGRCKAFDARADGFVRSEGCGVLVLKRLADAQANGDRLIALIRGGAVNQDGRSNGLTAPNGPAQESVLREALADAQLDPADVGFVEAHGTGTSLGDPIEVQALAQVLGRGRLPDAPLLVGSVKANIGHLEAAAGVAGLIKLALALRHGRIPGQPHLREPNPYIPWSEIAVRVPTALAPWPTSTDGRRIGGVSSFGFSGTNVHLLLEAAPAPSVAAPGIERPLHLLTASARQDPALRSVLQQRRDHLALTSDALADIAYTANAGRAHQAQRVAVIAASAAEAVARLDAQRDDLPTDGVFQGTAGVRAPRVAFLFTGQGSQSAGMAAELYATHPVFRDCLQRCDTLLRDRMPQPLLGVLFPPTGTATPIDETEYTQPVLFALEYALATLWMSWGVRPAVVMGHSVGELVAACIAGVFSLEDALTLVAERGRLMGGLARNGAMVAVAADEARVRAALAPYAGEVSVAAVNGPSSIVISGLASTVDRVAAALQAEGVECTRLKVSHAFHSPLLEPMLDAYERVAAGVAYRAPEIDLISNLTGAPLVAAPDAAYWRAHARQAVQFGPAVQAMVARGCTVAIEIGPHPVLIGMARQCPETDGILCLPTLRRGRGDWTQLLESLAALYTAGADIDWAAFDAPYSRKKCVLATYPFQRERYWVDVVPPAAAAPFSEVASAVHPLLGREVLQAASDDRIFETAVGPSRQEWLADHQILGSLLLPSPVHMEIALAAAAEQFGDGPLQLNDLTLHQALALDASALVRLQLVLAPPVDGHAEFRISARDDEARRWSTCVQGRAERASGDAAPVDLVAVGARTAESLDVGAYYDWLTSLGLEFGPRFRGITRLQRTDGEALARVELPAALQGEAEVFRLHPALLDACFHTVGAALPGAGRALSQAFLLLQAERIRVYRPLGRGGWVHVRVHAEARRDLDTRETFQADLQLLDDAGQVIADFTGMNFKRAHASALAQQRLPARVKNMLHELVWRRLPPVDGTLPAPARLAAQVAPSLDALVERHGLDHYAAFLPALDQLAAAYIVQAFRQLGCSLATGEVMEPEALATRLGVLPAHRRLLARMLAILGEDGVLLPVDSTWRVADVPTTDPEALADQLRERFPDGDAELTLTQRCARELASVLRGKADPLALLFPGGSLADTERLYRHSPPARTYNGLIAELVGGVRHIATEGRPLRVLEIGAGTGSTTAHVMDRLPGAVEYTFTDVSPLFLNRAREKFADRAGMRYQLLDISRPPVAQGFGAGSFDVVLAANVLHATEDLAVTLDHVHQLLAPGGLLILLEGTTPQRFGDLTVGLLDGWWAYRDTDRRDYALMPRAAWLRLLADAGFEGALALPGDDTTHPVLQQQAVFVASRRAVPAESQAARWLLVPDTAGVGDAVAGALRAAGDQVDMLPAAAEALGPALRRALAGGTRWDGVLHLQAAGLELDDRTPTESLWRNQEGLVRGSLQLLHGLMAQAGDAVPPLWLVTRGAQAAAPHEAANPLQATLWGLGYVAAIEHPELRCRCIDLDPAADLAAAAAGLLGALRAPAREDQLALRGGERLARRLVRYTPGAERASQAMLRVDPARSYLVTGGLRGVGLRVATWLADQGARYLVLMGRQAPLPAAEPVLTALRARGVQVQVETGDVAVEGDLQRVLDRCRREFPPLAGVMHAAGALDDGVLSAQTWERFATALSAKVRGSWNLHRLCGDLDFLALFSSGASVAGSAGQANHAAANAFEDALAWYREAHGLPGVSINWGPWADIGAAADRKLSGPAFLQLIAPDDGLLALSFALRRDAATGLSHPPQLAVLAGDWSKLGSEADATSPLFAELLSEAPARPATTVAAPGAAGAASRREPSWRERLAETAPNRRRGLLREQVRQMAAKVLGLPRADQLNIDEPLRQLGLDSLMAVELRNLLGKAVGQTLPATVTFDHPSVAALVEHLATTHFVAELAVPTAAIPETSQPAIADALDNLSEEELALQLLSRLDGIGMREQS